MKSKNLIYTGIVTLIVGIALVFLKSAAIDVVVMLVGIAFLLAAIINLYFVFSGPSRIEVEVNGKKKNGTTISVGSLVSAIAAAALGLWMILEPSSFSSLLVYVFSALIILAGLLHIFRLSAGAVKFPFGFYILPLILVVGGIVLLILGATTVKNSIVLITGIALIVYSVSNFLEAAGASRNSNKMIDYEER